jgi:hypothetical protein
MGIAEWMVSDVRRSARPCWTAFGDTWKAVWSAMTRLAKAFKPKELAELAFGLYEQFRPSIPEGVKGWGANGNLELGVIEELAKKMK